MERLTGIKPTLGCSGKAEGQTGRVLLLLWNKVRYLEVVSEPCLFIELRGKPSELFCCCGTFRGLQKVNELSYLRHV